MGQRAAANHHHVLHIRRIGDKLDERRQRKHPARRWVAERTLARLGLALQVQPIMWFGAVAEPQYSQRAIANWARMW